MHVMILSSVQLLTLLEQQRMNVGALHRHHIGYGFDSRLYCLYFFKLSFVAAQSALITGMNLNHNKSNQAKK